MGQSEHSRIIARAAKAALGPLEFKRKGQSCLWLADRGYWLSIVEFTPFRFGGKGSHLNVNAHWLWHPGDIITYDYGLSDMKRPNIEFQNREQFEPLARDQAELAAHEVKRLDERLFSFDEVARIVAERNQRLSEKPVRMPVRPYVDWSAMNAAVAAGILRDTVQACRLFDHFLSGPLADVDDRFGRLGDWGLLAKQSLREGRFSEFIKGTINDARARLGYPTWHGDF